MARRWRRSRICRGAWPASSSIPEVRHTEHGQTVLRRFLREVAGIAPGWTTAGIVADQVARIRSQVGSGRVICGLSGGVDSAVAAALVQRAVGDQLTCVFVDHGLLRKGEAEQVERDFVASTGVRLHVVDAVGRVPRRTCRRERSRGEAQNHWPRIHPRVRSSGPRDQRVGAGRFSGAGHALSGRRRVGRRERHREHQVTSQRRRAARRLAVRSRRAVADVVQRRGARGRRRAWPAGIFGVAAAVSWSRSCGAHHR